MRLHHHVAAAALAGTLLAGLPSARADTTIDPQMLDIISELSGVPQEELARDPDRWRDVAALLQRYLAEAGGQPAAAGTTPLPGAYPFPATFRQLKASLLELPARGDLASVVLSSGIAHPTTDTTAPRGPLEDSLQRVQSSSETPLPMREMEALQPLLRVSDPGSRSLLLKLYENARGGDGLQRMRGVLDNIASNGDAKGQALLQAQRSAGAMARRLSLLEEAVQKAEALGAASDPDAQVQATAKLAELLDVVRALLPVQDAETASLSPRRTVARAQ